MGRKVAARGVSHGATARRLEGRPTGADEKSENPVGFCILTRSPSKPT
jgi:hypothetical protein